MSQALPFRSALYQPRDVRQDELPAVKADDAKIGLKRRERIVGDLGLGRRHPGDERRLACVGESDQGRICQELELEREPLSSPEFPLLGHARSPVGRAHEGGVAQPATASMCCHHFLTIVNQVSDHDTSVVGDHRSQWHREDEVLSGSPMTHIPLTMSTTARGAVRIALVAQKRGYRRISPENHRPSPPAIAAGGFALGLALRSQKRDNPGTAATGADVDTNPVYERHGLGNIYKLTRVQRLGQKPDVRTRIPTRVQRLGQEPYVCTRMPTGVPGWVPRPADAYSVSTETRRLLLRTPYLTVPGAVANRVSSPPFPTLSPGWMWVPR